jgi:hypothetical protein
MKARPKQTTDRDWFHGLLTTTVDEINAATTALSQADIQQRGIEHRRAKKKLHETELVTGKPTSLGALMSLGPDEAELRMWRDYDAAERTRITSLFRELAVKGTLPKPELEEQFATVKRGMSYALHTEIRDDGRPVVEPRMVFDQTDPRTTLDAKLAMVLLTLAEGNGAQVFPCAHKNCGRLFIRWPADRGPRPEACQDHISAYRQARHRRIVAERAAKRATANKRRATKHK